ncbi:MAG: hypothetical protein ACRDHE_18380 [Ktedonobacterales bacterium]
MQSHPSIVAARRLPDVSVVEWGSVALPYGVRPTHIQASIQGVYDILDDMSHPLTARGVDRVEDFMLGNSLSGLISELLVQGLAQRTGLKRNVLVGGFPDLPPAHYPTNRYQSAPEGIEAKTTIQPRKLEAHHQFVGEFLLFQYFANVPDPETVPIAERWPIEFYGVVFGRVESASWWNKVSTGKTGRKTQNTTLKAEYLKPILRQGSLFIHPNRSEFLGRMKANSDARKRLAEQAGPELEAEDLPSRDVSEPTNDF